MRSILLAVACLSALALTQNVLVISPQPDAALHEGQAAVGSGMPERAAVAGFSVDEAPTGSTALLVAGLAGLMFAGGRRDETVEVEAAV